MGRKAGSDPRSITHEWKHEPAGSGDTSFFDPKSGRRFRRMKKVAEYLSIKEAYPDDDWELAALKCELDDEDFDSDCVDGWTVATEGFCIFFTEPVFGYRFKGKPDVLKYFKALRDAPLPRGTRSLHPKIVLLRAYVQRNDVDADRVNEWTWDEDKRRHVDPSSGNLYSGHPQILRVLKEMPAKATLEEDPERESPRPNKGEAPKDVMTDQSHKLSCRRTMGKVCLECGKPFRSYAALKRHRETEHPDKEPVQARKWPCRPCFTKRFGRGKPPRDFRGEEYGSCTFMGGGREQYWALEDLANKEAYMAYLEYLEESGHDQYLEEHGYDDLVFEESP